MQEKIKKILNNGWLWLLLSQLIIVYVSWRNMFPSGFTFSGADITQFFNFPRILEAFKYTWMNGHFLQYFCQSIYFVPIYLVSSIFNISPSGLSFFYYFIFLMGSFWSFYYSIGFYLKRGCDIDVKYKVLLSLLYTFNIYTFYNFYYTWGYSPFLFLYILIPVIFGATYRFFYSQHEKINIKILAILGIVFFLSNIANGNLPFFIALNIFLFLLILLIFLVIRKETTFINFFRKIFAYYSIYFLAAFWSVVPQVGEMFNIIRYFNNSEGFFDLKHWMIWQAVKFPNMFFVISNISQYIKSVSFLCSLSICMFIFLLLSYLFGKKQKDKASYIYLGLLITAIFLLNKGVGIIGEDLTFKIFDNPILSSIRSADKILIFFPFLLVVIFFLNIKDNLEKSRYIVYLYVILMLISVFPFFKGGIQTQYSVSFKDSEKNNYLTEYYSYLHKIPDEYYILANELNKDKENYNIFNTPYNVMNSIGWFNYTKWKVVGVDPTAQLFEKKIIAMNAPFLSFENFNYGGFWGQQEGITSVDWIFPFSSFLNTKYLIYHRDIHEDYIKQTEDKIKYSEKQGLIIPVEENDYFDVYKINEDYYYPTLYIPQDVVVSDEKPNSFPLILSQKDYKIGSAVYFIDQNEGRDIFSEDVFLKESISLPAIEFKKVNPIKYRIRLHKARGVFPLIFSETFNFDWKIYLANETKESYLPHDEDVDISKYKIFKGNEDDQADIDELEYYFSRGEISYLGDGGQKERKYIGFNDEGGEIIHKEQYSIDFISKKIKNTIQNDNLPDGAVYETWFKTPLENNKNHMMINGYSNSWMINSDQICDLHKEYCIKNEDGTYDIEFVIEFWPQRLYYLGIFVSGVTVLICLTLFIYLRKQ